MIWHVALQDYISQDHEDERFASTGVKLQKDVASLQAVIGGMLTSPLDGWIKLQVEACSSAAILRSQMVAYEGTGPDPDTRIDRDGKGAKLEQMILSAKKLSTIMGNLKGIDIPNPDPDVKDQVALVTLSIEDTVEALLSSDHVLLHAIGCMASRYASDLSAQLAAMRVQCRDYHDGGNWKSGVPQTLEAKAEDLHKAFTQTIKTLDGNKIEKMVESATKVWLADGL